MRSVSVIAVLLLATITNNGNGAKATLSDKQSLLSNPVSASPSAVSRSLLSTTNPSSPPSSFEPTAKSIPSFEHLSKPTSKKNPTVPKSSPKTLVPLCVAPETMLVSLGFAGYYCEAGTKGELLGDSNDGTTTEQICSAKGGKWTPYDCAKANSFGLTHGSTLQDFLRDKCCEVPRPSDPNDDVVTYRVGCFNDENGLPGLIPVRTIYDGKLVELFYHCGNESIAGVLSVESFESTIEAQTHPVCPEECQSLTVTESYCNGSITPGTYTIAYDNESAFDGDGFESDVPGVLLGVFCPPTTSSPSSLPSSSFQPSSAPSTVPTTSSTQSSLINIILPIGGGSVGLIVLLFVVLNYRKKKKQSSPDPTLCAISYAQLLEVKDQAMSLFKEDYGNKTMRDVNKAIIKPVCQSTRKSYAASINPDGLKLEVFVSHSWDEPIGEFFDSIEEAFEDTIVKPTFWICAFSLLQGNQKEIQAQLGLGDIPLHQSPFVRALKSANNYLVVRNRNTDLCKRIWVICEFMFARKFNFIPSKTIIAGPNCFEHTTTSCLDAKSFNKEDKAKILKELLNKHSYSQIDEFIASIKDKWSNNPSSHV